MTAKRLRGGMVGAGAWSRVQLDGWMSTEGAEIVAICDRHPERRDPVAEHYGIQHRFDSLETMLDGLQLDFIDICVRPYSHAGLVRTAAARGLSVLCQKPFCTGLAEAQDVVRYCADVGSRLMINENWRWQTWYRQAKDLIAAGTLGRPFVAKILQRTRSTLPAGFRDHPQPYFAEMPQLALYELGTHYLDTLRFLFGEPSTVFAKLQRVSPYIKGEDVVTAILDYGDLTCLIENSWASVQAPGIDTPEGVMRAKLLSRLEVDGTDGTLALHPDGSLHLTTDSEHREWRYQRDQVFDASHTAALQHFIDCLESGVEFETSGAETLKTMGLVYAAYRSTETGRPVDPHELAAESELGGGAA